MRFGEQDCSTDSTVNTEVGAVNRDERCQRDATQGNSKAQTLDVGLPAEKHQVTGTQFLAASIAT